MCCLSCVESGDLTPCSTILKIFVVADDDDDDCVVFCAGDDDGALKNH